MFENLSPEETYGKFEKACVKLETWLRLYEDEDFYVNSFAKNNLAQLKQEYDAPELIAKFDEECEGLTTFEEEVKRLETEIEFNDIVDNADQIYADILKYAKVTAPHLDKLGLDKNEFIDRAHNMGLLKYDIDEDKEVNKELSKEKIYPKMVKVEPILDKHLAIFLFG